MLVTVKQVNWFLHGIQWEVLKYYLGGIISYLEAEMVEDLHLPYLCLIFFVIFYSVNCLLNILLGWGNTVD